MAVASGVSASVRWRRCFGRRRSPRWQCSDDLWRPRAGPDARCVARGSEGLPGRGKRECAGQAHRGKGNGARRREDGAGGGGPVTRRGHEAEERKGGHARVADEGEKLEGEERGCGGNGVPF
jgi:hypothetical protein